MTDPSIVVGGGRQAGWKKSTHIWLFELDTQHGRGGKTMVFVFRVELHEILKILSILLYVELVIDAEN